ncbi:hypothetical protein FRC12_017556 [Ceratobasidium sp. 428]|nr:hypothetical protein FRC12_017556 [Ceratobasidium sp. 428]
MNKMLKKMFDVLAQYLSSPDSRHILTNKSHGWFGPDARNAIPKLGDTFVCNPKASYHGFKSWDDLFTRRFCAGARPVGSPEEANLVSIDLPITSSWTVRLKSKASPTHSQECSVTTS